MTLLKDNQFIPRTTLISFNVNKINPHKRSYLGKLENKGYSWTRFTLPLVGKETLR
jgi:hypothetical protein